MDAPQSCEVVILTALPVEYQAVVAYLQNVQEVIYPQTGTVYHTGSFQGLERTWRVAVAQIGMGGLGAASETTQANSFFHPRIVLFIGVAGGLKDVQLGDVVVATKVYAYESGKAEAEFKPRPDFWKASYALEQRARTEANDEAWLDHLGNNRPDRLPRISIGPLAAGEKVVASQRSSVYDFLQKNYGDALAVEMESHGFLQATRADQSVHAAVIRGISDLIDGKVNADTAGWQEIAAQHASAFAFQMLAKFTLPSDLLRPLSLLNLPYDQNPFFTGREEELRQLHTRLWQRRSAVVGQKSAISGLGGVGKTQLTVEYAYRHHLEYRYILWARADSVESLNSSYAELATLLDLPEKDEKEQEVIVQAVKCWLQRQENWLLVLDSADTPELLSAFLPSRVGGHLLITTRTADLSAQVPSLAHPLVVEVFSEEQGALFLLHRSDLLASDAPLEQAEEDLRRRAVEMSHELGGLPLALNQAGAYIATRRCGLAVYRQLYQQHRTRLLKERWSADYPRSVATTWSLSFERVEQASALAAEVLRLCAFLAPDAIPEELLVQALIPEQQATEGVSWELEEAVATLRAYSLIQRQGQDRLLQVHRLVQAVVRDMMAETEQVVWITRMVSAVESLFPWGDVENWAQCERYLLQALVCAEWMREKQLLLSEGASVCYSAGYYLHSRAQYEEAEPLYQQALQIWEKSLGPGHPQVASPLNGLASLYSDQGKYEQAEPLYQRALQIWEKSLGLEHPQVASPLNNLANLYKGQGKYEQAEPLYQRALQIREKSLGPEHPYVAALLNNLALLYSEQGKYEQAEPLYQRALQIMEKSLGPEHLQVAALLNNLAGLYREQGKYEQAEPLYQRALQIMEKSLGLEHPQVASPLNGLAGLYSDQGKYEQAEPLYQRALQIWEKSLGLEHPQMASPLNNLANLYKGQGKYEQAEPLYQRALQIREKSLGETHPSTQTVRKNYARLLRAMGRSEEAEALEERFSSGVSISEEDCSSVSGDTLH